MTRTVTDAAKLLDVMVGYDPDDPVTALGFGKTPETYTKFLDKNGLKGARIGILRTPMGYTTEPDSDDFKTVTGLFDKAVAELKAPAPRSSIRSRCRSSTSCWRGAAPATAKASATARRVYFSRHPNPKFRTMAEVRKLAGLRQGDAAAVGRRPARARPLEAAARDELMINIMKVMADHKLDAIVHKTVEHTPTLIKDGINPPVRQSEGRAAPQHVPDLRRVDGRAGRLHAAGTAGRHHLLRPCLQRADDHQAGLRLRAGDEASPPAAPPRRRCRPRRRSHPR